MTELRYQVVLTFKKYSKQEVFSEKRADPVKRQKIQANKLDTESKGPRVKVMMLFPLLS